MDEKVQKEKFITIPRSEFNKLAKRHRLKPPSDECFEFFNKCLRRAAKDLIASALLAADKRNSTIIEEQDIQVARRQMHK
jgi:histone H3/H4